MINIITKFATKLKKLIKRFGAWAGRLGNGLQNRVERFDSARHLNHITLYKDCLLYTSPSPRDRG